MLWTALQKATSRKRLQIAKRKRVGPYGPTLFYVDQLPVSDQET